MVDFTFSLPSLTFSAGHENDGFICQTFGLSMGQLRFPLCFPVFPRIFRLINKSLCLPTNLGLLFSNAVYYPLTRS